jgi:hypothetical protein
MVCVCPIEGYEPNCNDHGIDRNAVHRIISDLRVKAGLSVNPSQEQIRKENGES